MESSGKTRGGRKELNDILALFFMGSVYFRSLSFQFFGGKERGGAIGTMPCLEDRSVNGVLGLGACTAYMGGTGRWWNAGARASGQ